jgi:hypothetical protein
LSFPRRQGRLPRRRRSRAARPRSAAAAAPRAARGRRTVLVVVRNERSFSLTHPIQERIVSRAQRVESRKSPLGQVPLLWPQRRPALLSSLQQQPCSNRSGESCEGGEPWSALRSPTTP